MKGDGKMYISTYLGVPRGHKNFDFVDITTNTDTELFIDPCLIEFGKDRFSQEAAMTFSDFADRLYREMRASRWRGSSIFDEAHEVHETRLGYGNGHNGKGKTPQGMRNSLNELCRLVKDIPTISCIQDIPVFVKDFAEDCMSDLLTNILRRLLSQFTAEQMEHYGCNPDGYHTIRYWDCECHDWALSQEPYWLVNGRKVLLVPKRWVRKNFLFKAHQYLFVVILERLKEEPAFLDLPKQVIWKNIERNSPHWEYDKVKAYTRENPEALEEYHQRMPLYYARSYGTMSDDELDEAVYQNQSCRTA
ncbi:MAG: hypothetical protein IJN44_02655 [Clostridia bacterium]|nr:hypothetical protein [Clostridia bacterium]